MIIAAIISDIAQRVHRRTPASLSVRSPESNLSSFSNFLAGAAVELLLPITMPNPAHAQFISREHHA
jgi:hypothetical protein